MAGTSAEVPIPPDHEVRSIDEWRITDDSRGLPNKKCTPSELLPPIDTINTSVGERYQTIVSGFE
ncbi:hypothetical protein YC2023_010825 [Brassica napus]